MLFTYNDIKTYLNNLPGYCKEALEASGYKDKGYIDNFGFIILHEVADNTSNGAAKRVLINVFCLGISNPIGKRQW